MKLSILICSLDDRKNQCQKLVSLLIDQLRYTNTSLELQTIAHKQGVVTRYKFENAEILVYTDNKKMLIGEKRNELLFLCEGEYLCFIDDDDMVSEHYISTIFDGIDTNPDCISLRGIITTDYKNPQLFEHSIKYKAYKTTDNIIKYERYPNHLNVIRSLIAKRFRFPEINHGEDTDWATQIFNSGLLKTEFYTSKVLYNYLFKSNK